MNRKHELYVDMNEVMEIFHSFDNNNGNDNGNDNGVTADSDEQMNLVDEIIDEYNLIPSNIKAQKKCNINSENYKERSITPFECVKSNSKVSNSNSNSNSSSNSSNSNSINSSRETKANGGDCCITSSSCNNTHKCCCCIVDNDKITQLIKLVNTLHTKLNETNSKLTALHLQTTSHSKLNFPSENPHNTKYTITSNTNTISYTAITSHPDIIPISNKPKRSYNDTFLLNINASKKQQPITSFLHKQFKHK